MIPPWCSSFDYDWIEDGVGRCSQQCHPSQYVGWQKHNIPSVRNQHMHTVMQENKGEKYEAVNSFYLILVMEWKLLMKIPSK